MRARVYSMQLNLPSVVGCIASRGAYIQRDEGKMMKELGAASLELITQYQGL